MCFFSDGSGSPFAYFWVTDSCPVTIKAIEKKAPFEVISLAGSIADALQIQNGDLVEGTLKTGGICNILFG